MSLLCAWDQHLAHKLVDARLGVARSLLGVKRRSVLDGPGVAVEDPWRLAKLCTAPRGVLAQPLWEAAPEWSHTVRQGLATCVHSCA